MKKQREISTRHNPAVIDKASTAGITLIALVVTIIVLIILAGISINLILGENGIITKATNAREASRAASVQEQKDLWQASKDADAHTGSATTESLQSLIDRLVEEGLLTEEEKDKILGNEEKEIEATGKVTIGEKTIVFKEAAKTLVQAFKDGEIKVGDYLDYKPIEGATLETPLTQEKTGVEEEQNYTVDMSTTWRVLGLNEDGTELMITSGSPIKRNGEDPYLHLASAEGYTYGEEILDTISKIYHNSAYATETRSMTMEDITRVLGINVDKEKNIAYKTGDATKTELSSYYGQFGEEYKYTVGDYAPENYLGTGSIRVGDIVEANYYELYYSDSEAVESTSLIYDVLFRGTTEEDNCAKSYWLASSSAYIDQEYAGFGLGIILNGIIDSCKSLIYSDGEFVERAYAVRPIIFLKSNITVEDIKLITAEEKNWETSLGDILGYIDDGYLTKGKVYSAIGPVQFTIDGVTYYADEEMSWEKWLYSDYNTLIPKEELKYATYVWWDSEYGTSAMSLNGSSGWVLLTATITEGQEYTITNGIPM